MTAPAVHWLTLNPLAVACEKPRKEPLVGAPLNTTIRDQVTCPGCLALIGRTRVGQLH